MPIVQKLAAVRFAVIRKCFSFYCETLALTFFCLCCIFCIQAIFIFYFLIYHLFSVMFISFLFIHYFFLRCVLNRPLGPPAKLLSGAFVRYFCLFYFLCFQIKAKAKLILLSYLHSSLSQGFINLIVFGLRHRFVPYLWWFEVTRLPAF